MLNHTIQAERATTLSALREYQEKEASNNDKIDKYETEVGGPRGCGLDVRGVRGWGGAAGGGLPREGVGTWHMHSLRAQVKGMVVWMQRRAMLGCVREAGRDGREGVSSREKWCNVMCGHAAAHHNQHAIHLGGLHPSSLPTGKASQLQSNTHPCVRHASQAKRPSTPLSKHAGGPDGQQPQDGDGHCEQPEAAAGGVCRDCRGKQEHNTRQ